MAASAAAGYTLRAAVTISQLLGYWREAGGITEADYSRVRAYLAETGV